jgi:hypothetical protein
LKGEAQAVVIGGGVWLENLRGDLECRVRNNGAKEVTP